MDHRRPYDHQPGPVDQGAGDELAWTALAWAVDRLAETGADEPPDGFADELPAADDHPAAGPDASQDHERYRAWLAARSGRREWARGWRRRRLYSPNGPADGSHGHPPIFTVAVPVYRPELWFLRRCVESVRAQSWPHWELCLCDDGSGDPALAGYLRHLARRDRRIRVASLAANAGISTATDRAVALGSGGFVALLDHDDELVPHAFATMAGAVVASAGADVLYSDEDKLDQDGRPFGPRFKPDWSPDYLLTTPYLGHLLVVRRSLWDGIGGLRPEMDGSQDYDLMLRATEAARSVVHVPEVLYHWRIVTGSAAGDHTAKPWAYAATGRALGAALDRRGEDATLEPGPMPGMWHVRRRLPADTSVSVVVAARSGARDLRRCVDGLTGAGEVGAGGTVGAGDGEGRRGGLAGVEVAVAAPERPDLEMDALLGHLAERGHVSV
ncbi:MAG: glycosyltransferase family 2 protein, partial [Acidimicrobiales bacterium]